MKHSIKILKRRLPLEPRLKKLYLFLAIFLAIISVILLYYRLVSFFVALIFLIVLIAGYFVAKIHLKKYQDIKRMEESFPDFISLTASNLRAGLTIDKSLLLSARKEFEPLDKEILALGKDIVTGKETERAMLDMADRINSSEIRKTILLINSGIRAGGNLAVLLEQVSSSMRERMFVQKRAASNVLMYVIFIFFAVAVGAPMLFALSTVLVEILSKIVSNIPVEQVSSINVKLPFTLTSISISTTFIKYFSLIFLLASDILSALVLGLVSKGKEKEGVKYIFPLVALSVGTFFGMRLIISRYFSDFFG